MRFLSRQCRLARIAYIAMKYGLDELILSIPWFKPIQYIMRLNPFYWIRNRNLPRGERLRLALETLGPLFVKFGQVLSTRRDLLPLDIADALANLQDKVKPFSGEQAQQRIEQSLRHPGDLGELL